MKGGRRPPEVPGWKIVGHVGAGGMGDVWKARRADGALAAIKVVKAEGLLTPEKAATLFRREALACFNVEHPSVVRAIDAGTTADGASFLALEWVEGRTLLAVLLDGAMPEPRVVEIGTMLARALVEVHRKGLVHLDVKPRNVMIEPSGAPKLLDFGLVMEWAGGRGHEFGTPGFIAPEIAEGKPPGPGSDLFSLGATLASAALGEIPGRERSFADMEMPSSAAGRPLSAGFRRVVERLLASDPAARYRTAAEVVLDFESVAAGERPLGAILGSRAATAVRRGPVIAVVAACAVAAIGAVWWVVTRESEPTPATSPETVAEPESQAVVLHPEIEAARVFLERFPDDRARAREVLDRAAAAAVSPAELEELERLRGTLAARTAAAADREHAERSAQVRTALDAGDIAEARRLESAWPEEFRDSSHRQQLASEIAAAEARLRADAASVADDALRAIRDLAALAEPGGDPAAGTTDRDLDALATRLDAALARPAFDGDRRDEILGLRSRLAAARKAVVEARATGEAVARWRAALTAHVVAPSGERFREALAAAREERMPAGTRDDAEAVAAALARAETWLAARIGAVDGAQWCGPRGATLFCGSVEKPPAPDEVFLAGHWSVTGGRSAAVVVAAKGADEGAAWLLARGLVGEAADACAPAGPVARLLADVPHGAASPTAAVTWPRAFDAALALRAMGDTTSATAVRPGDPVLAAWAAAAAGKSRPPGAPVRNAAKEAGTDAFLSGGLGPAAESLTLAMVADPWDAEVAALRGRVFLSGARKFPTAPALLAAFSEGRRAWDLDEKLPAGPLLVAECGLELARLAGPDVARVARPVTAAACEAADARGRADARMLAFAGEHHLDAGRAPQAAALLRRAVSGDPEAGPAWLLLARAEHGCGRTDRARDALRRAREVLGGALPESAEELARTLGL